MLFAHKQESLPGYLILSFNGLPVAKGVSKKTCFLKIIFASFCHSVHVVLISSQEYFLPLCIFESPIQMSSKSLSPVNGVLLSEREIIVFLI